MCVQISHFFFFFTIFKLVINIQKTNLDFDITLICWLENTLRLVTFDDSMKQNTFKLTFPYVGYLEKALRLKLLHCQ